MLTCFNPKSTPPSPPTCSSSSSSSTSSFSSSSSPPPPPPPPPPPQDNIGTSESSDHESPPTTSNDITVVNHTCDEYSLAVQTNSYNEIWSKIHIEEPEEEVTSTHFVSQVLQPNHQQINDALNKSKPNNLTRLVSSYFDNSESSSHLCFNLNRSIDRARTLYAPIHELIQVLPIDSLLSQPQCDRTFDIFSQFHLLENPFPNPDSKNFQEMRNCFSLLKQELDQHLRKARKRTSFHRRAVKSSAVCLIGAGIGIAVSAVAIATHALVVVIASAPFLALLPRNFAKKQLHRIAQLDAAAMGTYVLLKDLDTIDRLVARLHSTVESDKALVRFGLERGRDTYVIHEVVKQFRKNHSNFLLQLKDLEEHVCLCFTRLNRARSLILEKIHLHQTRNNS